MTPKFHEALLQARQAAACYFDFKSHDHYVENLGDGVLKKRPGRVLRPFFGNDITIIFRTVVSHIAHFGC